jgi:hypothetical protein
MKVDPYLKLFLPIFYLEFLELVRSPFYQISLNYFKLIQINAKPYYSTVSRPTCQHPPLCFRPATCAVHVACVRRARAAAGRRPLVGARPHDAAPRRMALPQQGRATLPLFFPLCRAADRLFSNRARDAVRSSITHSSLVPLSSAAPLPTALHTRTTASGHWTPSLARIPTERRRRPPFPGELLPEPPILAIFSPLAPPELQDLITLDHDHRSSFPAGERRRAGTLLPPPRRPAARVRATPARLAWRHPEPHWCS